MTKTTAKVDPIFTAIEAHKEAYRTWSKINTELDRKEHTAWKQIGHRPIELIIWRNYHIGQEEIKIRRDAFLDARVASPRLIRAEYRDALDRYRTQCRKAAAWDRRAGLARLRREHDRLLKEEWIVGWKLGRTEPTTPGGAGAMLEYIEVQSRDTDLSGWYREGVLTVVKVLKAMRCQPALKVRALA